MSPGAAFFYCEIDGSSLCLQCDMVVHVGGKQTHKRYLLLRQRVEVSPPPPPLLLPLASYPSLSVPLSLPLLLPLTNYPSLFVLLSHSLSLSSLSRSLFLSRYFLSASLFLCHLYLLFTLHRSRSLCQFLFQSWFPLNFCNYPVLPSF